MSKTGFGPSGLHRADGGNVLHSTTRQIAHARRRARTTAWFWQRCGCHAESLALLDAAGATAPELRLRAAYALDLNATFLELLGKRPVRGWTVAARGLSHLALGDADAASADLAVALKGSADSGLWLRAAAAFAVLDAKHVRDALADRREAAARLLLAHLTGDAAGVPESAERDLLQGDAARMFARFGLAEDAPAIEGPRVSVIVAAYNAERTIAAALASLAAQSWRNLEILVVDDASTDRTAALAARFRLIRQPVNRGAYVARNVGVAAATGDFIAFHDADDVAHPERIARQMAPLLQNKELAFTTARWVRRDAMGKFRCRQIAPLLRLHVGSMLVGRPFLDAVGEFDPVRYGADSDMLLRLKVAAGPRRFEALTLPLTIGGYDPKSAVHDPATGYGERGFSRARQDYRERRTLALIERLR
ncbi:MAG TPA: glycosyltransferase family A protein [Rhizomicrobium sp.]|nr:glycosyltransferase family A protein [Rhizomicrobium sp.]